MAKGKAKPQVVEVVEVEVDAELAAKVRSLKTKDLIAFGNIMRACSAETRKMLAEMALARGADGDDSDVPRRPDPQVIGMAVFEAVLDHADEVMEFFGSLVNMSGEEFAETDPDAILDIILVLAERPEFPRFFDKVTTLAQVLARNLTSSGT